MISGVRASVAGSSRGSGVTGSSHISGAIHVRIDSGIDFVGNI